jgi:hypothetical protein
LAVIAVFLIALAVATPPQSPPTQPPPGGRATPRDPVTEKKGTAIIKGKVTSGDTGRPLRRAQIRLTAPELTEPRTTSTNTLGAYEIRDLPAGRYTVNVTRSGHLTLQYGQRRPGEPPKPLQIADGQVIDRLDFALPRAGVISGRVIDETGDPFAGVTIWAMQPQFFQGRRHLVPISAPARSDDAGQYRVTGLAPGDYIVMALIRETWTTDGDTKQVFSYAPSYFAGTAAAADAQRVKVGVGQEIAAVDIGMLPVRAAVISGTALSWDGTPLAGGSISVNSEITGPNGGSYSSAGGTTVAADGTWRIRDVPPGEYQLTASSSNNRTRPSETAAITLVVQGADVDGIALVSDPGGTLLGRVVTDDGGPLPAGRAPLSIYGQTVVPGRRGSLTLIGDDNGVVGPDGAFTVKGLTGPNMLQVRGLPSGWAVRRIEVVDKDYVDGPIEITNGRQIDGARIVLSRQFPTVHGRIVDDKGAPAEGTVLLFPSDPPKWLQAAGTLRTARPDQSGGFRLDTVRPGDYLAVALEYVEQWQVNDPEFLEELRDSATKVRLVEGQNQELTLRVKK